MPIFGNVRVCESFGFEDAGRAKDSGGDRSLVVDEPEDWYQGGRKVAREAVERGRADAALGPISVCDGAPADERRCLWMPFEERNAARKRAGRELVVGVGEHH